MKKCCNKISIWATKVSCFRENKLLLKFPNLITLHTASSAFRLKYSRPPPRPPLPTIDALFTPPSPPPLSNNGYDQWFNSILPRSNIYSIIVEHCTFLGGSYITSQGMQFNVIYWKGRKLWDWCAGLRKWAQKIRKFWRKLRYLLTQQQVNINFHEHSL